MRLSGGATQRKKEHKKRAGGGAREEQRLSLPKLGVSSLLPPLRETTTERGAERGGQQVGRTDEDR